MTSFGLFEKMCNEKNWKSSLKQLNKWIVVQSFSGSDSLRPHGLQHARLPCPSPSPGACSNSCPLSQWCHPLILCHLLLLLPSIFPRVMVFLNELALQNRWPNYWSSASSSVLPVKIQYWFPLGLTGLISLPSKELSRVFSNTTVQKHQASILWRSAFFMVQLSHPYMTTGKTMALTRRTLVGKVFTQSDLKI